MQTLTIIRGLPGSGKTTLAHQIALASGAVVIEADQYFTRKNGEYVFNALDLASAHNWCFDTAANNLCKGNSVIVSNTFTRKWEYERYLDLAEDLKIKTVLLVCKSSFKSVHNVPQDQLERMAARWED